MNVLFVTGHPAQVHNFRVVRDMLIRNGHNIFWLTTKKDIATDLLDIYKIQYEIIPRAPKSLCGRIYYMFKNVFKLMLYLKKHKIDIVVDRCEPVITVSSWLLRIPHICLFDTEHAAVMCKYFIKMCSCSFVPDCFYLNVVNDMMRFPGNVELFYCHPNRYKKNAPWDILDIPINTQYALVRFVKWDSYHDTKLVGGFSVEQKIKLIKTLSSKIKVFVSSESALPNELEMYRIKVPIDRMHDVQTYATLFIGESATMASESVVLGTPALYIDEVGRGYTDEEARECLLWMYRPVANKSELSANEKYWISGGVEECVEKACEIAGSSFDYLDWKCRQNKWLKTKIDCSFWLSWIIEGYPNSIQEWKNYRNEIYMTFL